MYPTIDICTSDPDIGAKIYIRVTPLGPMNPRPPALNGAVIAAVADVRGIIDTRISTFHSSFLGFKTGPKVAGGKK